MPALQREFADDQIAWVAQHPLFQAMKDGIDAGEILPCLRKGELHFYERGARLLSFSKMKAYTHALYAGKKGDRYVALPDKANFEPIRDTARKHRDTKLDSELAAVHKLFPAFAATRVAHRLGELALIDVEIRFGKGEKDPTLLASMIDLAFLLPNRQLLFVEVKCIGNPSISSKTTAKVETTQVPRYEKHIKRDGVLKAINRSLSAQSMLVARDIGQANAIFPKVPVLILNPTDRQNPVSANNLWLKRRLADASSWAPTSTDACIIDGMSDPINAITEFVQNCT